MWFSMTGFVLLLLAQSFGLVENKIGGSVFQVSMAMVFLAAAYSFLATLLYFIVSVLLPRGATITTRIIAAIAFFGGLAVSAFVAERIGTPNPPGIIAFPVATVLLIAVDFLFLRHRYRKV